MLHNLGCYSIVSFPFESSTYFEKVITLSIAIFLQQLIVRCAAASLSFLHLTIIHITHDRQLPLPVVIYDQQHSLICDMMRYIFKYWVIRIIYFKSAHGCIMFFFLSYPFSQGSHKCLHRVVRHPPSYG